MNIYEYREHLKSLGYSDKEIDEITEEMMNEDVYRWGDRDWICEE